MYLTKANPQYYRRGVRSDADLLRRGTTWKSVALAEWIHVCQKPIDEREDVLDMQSQGELRLSINSICELILNCSLQHSGRCNARVITDYKKGPNDDVAPAHFQVLNVSGTHTHDKERLSKGKTEKAPEEKNLLIL